MKKIWNYIKPLAGLILVGLLAYFFFDLFVYFVIAAVLSFMGRPLCSQIKRISIRRWHVPDGLAAFLTIICMLIVFGVFIFAIVPLIVKQAAMVSKIDVNSVVGFFQEPINKAYEWLISIGVVESGWNLTDAITLKLKSLLNITNVSSLFGRIISMTSSIVVGIFSVIFLLFFFLRDSHILRNIVMALTPEKQELKMGKVLTDTRYLLSRYFLGLFLEMVCMMTLVTLFLTILGIKNALLIGFIVGILNVIPYLGPLIGGTLGTILVVISTLSMQQYGLLIPNVVKVIASCVVANTVDNMLLQPLIYSKSVKAHPVEIFLVILISGEIGGIIGMIVAVPLYTVIRIVAKQFFGELKFFGALVKSLDEDDEHHDDGSAVEAEPVVADGGNGSAS